MVERDVNTSEARGAPAVVGDMQRLEAERDAAVAHARELEMELGRLRGRIKRLEMIIWPYLAWRDRWRSRGRRLAAKVRCR